MKPLLHWLDQRTGLLTSLGNWFQRPIAGGPAWRFVWPTTIAFTLVVQAITGLVLWMYYSAGAQSSWESVYYLQYQVLGGWLLRAIHFYTGQATLVLVGIYLVQMVLRGAYRPPREFLFWTVLLMGLATLGLNLTGDLLAWDQNSFWATSIRVAYLSHLPVIGPWLCQAGDRRPAVRHLDDHALPGPARRGLHGGLAGIGLAPRPPGFAPRHGGATHCVRRATEGGVGVLIGRDRPGATRRPASSCWRSSWGCRPRHGVSGPQAGIELGAPANPVDDPGTARPEWSFRGLYQLHEIARRMAGDDFDLRHPGADRAAVLCHALDRPKPLRAGR